MKSLLSALLLSAVLAAGGVRAHAASLKSGVYESDPAHTNILWSVTHHGASNYIGRFNGIKATLNLDRENPRNSSVIAEIQVASIDTNYPLADKDFDAEVAGNAILNAASYPVIMFKSTAVELGPENTAKVRGTLTMHGKTKEIALDTKLNAMINPHPITKGPVIGFSAKARLKRSDFGINFGQGSIGDDVPITIEIEFVGN
ncbi:YceI family protein [Rhizobium leguminosarum]